MKLNFFDVFRFFTETELTEEQRRYELICVAALCVILLIVSIAGIVRNKRKSAERREKQNVFEEK